MYDFIYSEVWWISIIIISLSAGISAFVGTSLAYNLKLMKIECLLERLLSKKTTDTRTADREIIFKEHRELSNKLDALNYEHYKIILSIEGVEGILREVKEITNENRNQIYYKVAGRM